MTIKEQIQKNKEEFDKRFPAQITTSNKALGKVIIDMLEGEKKESSKEDKIFQCCKKCGKPEVFGSGLFEGGFNQALTQAQSIIKSRLSL